MPATAISAESRSCILEDTDWKLQRKLKHHHRDAGRRAAKNRAEPRFKHHGHSYQRAKVIRAEKDAWLPCPAKTAHWNIPIQLRHPADALSHDCLSQLSRSGPLATSWPPAWTFTEKAMDLLTLASSASPTANTKRQDEHRRKTRPMTLFESARIFNESGQLLSHATFDEMDSSPEINANNTPKRKLKRQVGRRKYETQHSVDALSVDKVVLELMCLLFPDVEVTQELNVLLLGGANAQYEDVFHFDGDEILDIPAPNPKRNIPNLDLLKFQAALTTMLFHQGNAIEQVPARGTSAETLLEMYFTPQWIAREMLVIVKLDVFAQCDRFTVMSAIFRTVSNLRPCILAAATSTSLAIFQHQSLANLVPGDDSKDLVTVKGMIAFLNAAIDILEWDVRTNVEMLSTTDNEICDAISGLCSQITCAIRLLVRSSPGGCKNSDSNRNQLDIYAECSHFAEATTYRAMGELVTRMAVFSPTHGENFLCWMLQKWPQRNVQLQLLFVRFTARLLSQFMQLGFMLPADVVRCTFTRIQACIQSTHFLVAQEACSMCGDFQLMRVHLSGDQILRDKLASALHANASSHWNRRIREISE